MENSQSIIFTPMKLGKTELRNRTIRSAAFEGMAVNNRPSKQLKDYHTSVAKGGIGMTTLAYASVNRSGVSFNTQLCMEESIIPDLADIADSVHKEGAAISIQLGHCGNMTHFKTAGGMPIAPCSGFNLYSPTIHRRMTEKDITGCAKDFGRAVNIAAKAGLDAVEIHAGHGYLISQFLSPYTNRRKDSFGGSLENRMRFMDTCMEEVMNAARKNNISVLVKTNMRDGFKGGMEIDDCIRVAKRIESYGVDAIVLSGGFVSKAPMYVMRGSMPIRTLSHYMDMKSLWWLKFGIRMFGKMMIPDVPFKEAYFLEDALRFRKEIKTPLVYVGGLVRKSKIEEVLSDGFEFVQMGRALINTPDFVNRMRDGMDRCGCDHKNYCIARMYSIDMACCQHMKDSLPKPILRELGLDK